MWLHKRMADPHLCCINSPVCSRDSAHYSHHPSHRFSWPDLETCSLPTPNSTKTASSWLCGDTPHLCGTWNRPFCCRASCETSRPTTGWTAMLRRSPAPICTPATWCWKPSDARWRAAWFHQTTTKQRTAARFTRAWNLSWTKTQKLSFTSTWKDCSLWCLT